MTAPLEGIRIIELGQMVAVPLATQLLASYGAEVIKIENTGTGDELRFYGSNKGGISAMFAHANSGKRSVALDLKDEAGKKILWQLLETTDALSQQQISIPCLLFINRLRAHRPLQGSTCL